MQPPLPHPLFGFTTTVASFQCSSDRRGPRLLDHRLLQSYAIDIGKTCASQKDCINLRSKKRREFNSQVGRQKSSELPMQYGEDFLIRMQGKFGSSLYHITSPKEDPLHRPLHTAQTAAKKNQL